MRLVAVPLTLSGGTPIIPDTRHIRHRLEGETMGTLWSVEFYAPSSRRSWEFQLEIQATLDAIISEMSHWDRTSTLSRFNHSPAGTWIDLPKRLETVLTCAIEVARATDGAFDPTLGQAVNQWGFGPPDGPVDGIRGWRHLRIENSRALQPGGLRLDLSAIAKGYAVDEIASAMASVGAVSYLVEIGGELRAHGVKPGGEPWWVEIERPPEDPTRNFPELLVALCGESIATSGDYRKFLIRDGVRYAHTIDPATGAPVPHQLASVTVIHTSCMQADAYSTALTAMGRERGIEYAGQHRLAAMFVERTEAGFNCHISPMLIEMLA
jgi:thiamine biosynthesis lipoprotein